MKLLKNESFFSVEPGPDEKSSAPRFIEKLQPQRVPDGATVQLECKVEGVPRPQIAWFRQTAVIKPCPEFQVKHERIYKFERQLDPKKYASMKDDNET